jgi:transcriptional regulator with XRE-family HTH domain
MSEEAYGATIAKLRLARRLTELRVAAGYTANHVCDMLNWGRGKVGRFEANQWKRPEMSDIRDLLRFYEADEYATREIEALALQARVRPWWRDYQDIFDNEFPGFEADACRIRLFLPLVVPGLLQTADYIDAVMRSSAKPPAWRRRATEARLRRQQILERDKATLPQLQAVITEASLLYRWGSRAERRDQLLHLAEMGERPGVHLHLQRFADGPPPGLFSAVQIFDYDGGEASLVFTEHDHGIQEVSDAEYMNNYVEAFDRAVDVALEPRDTAMYLKQLSERLE